MVEYKMKLKPINGWTKEKILRVLETRPNKEKAYDKDNLFCVYLDNNGNKCAVGMFIPDGHSAQQYLGDADQLFSRHRDLLEIMPFSPYSMVIFQSIHDTQKPDANAKQAMIDWVKENVED